MTASIRLLVLYMCFHTFPIARKSLPGRAQKHVPYYMLFLSGNASLIYAKVTADVTAAAGTLRRMDFRVWNRLLSAFLSGMFAIN